MYQVPVQRLDRIRTSRKRVKEILTDIGLDSCQDFLKEDKSGDNGEQCYEKTEWNDLTDCYQTKRKKWCYRTQPLCCSLCWFSCRSWQTFRNHVQRCHDEEGDLASLSPCPACAYICRPDLLSKHAKLFHTQPQAAPAGSSNGNTGNKVTKTLAGVRVTTVGPGGDKYSCAACGYHDSLLYVMRKHVLLTHCKALLQRYYKSPGSNETWTTVKQSKFSCCVCKMPAETSEHLLYHLLSSTKHQELQAHIKPLLVEHCSVAKIAPAGSKVLKGRLITLTPGGIICDLLRHGNSTRVQTEDFHALSQVNGMPTYTLAAVQMAVPVQSGVAKPPVLVNVPPQAPPVAQANPSAAQTNRAALSSPTGKVPSASGVLECLLCKSVFPDQGLHLHLLHGMKCLLCPLVFYTFRQLVSHCDEAHGLAAAVNRDQLWKNHRLLVTKDSRLLSPKPIVSLKVPKDLLGCPELHLALVNRFKIYNRVWLTKAPGTPANGQPSCPFCTDLRPRGPAADVQHLRRRHHVMHAIHAILKTPAFKCVYCLGVYMEPSSARTISIHVQRCRCAPHSAKEAERRLNPDPASAGGPDCCVSRCREGLEAPPGPEPYVDSPTEIPAGLAQRPLSERKLFLNKYFHKTPYPTRKEIEFLVLRLKLSQPEVTSIFSSKRRRCREDCRRRGLRVLLGFDSSHLKAVKHNLVIPHGQTSQGTASHLRCGGQMATLNHSYMMQTVSLSSRQRTCILKTSEAKTVLGVEVWTDPSGRQC
uniref:ADNP homeobox 2a n=1 Tax=Gadus morhua TaxID=8049 RepID=A0A8C4ZS20_GADMO